MLKRLIVGLFLGAVVGAILAAVLVQGLGVMSFDASSLGAAGKPIWAADGRIEAGLKAFFGALLALGGMFVLRQWVHVAVDLSALKASNGPGLIGELPAATLPIIAAVLAGFFELDNTGDDGEKKDGKAEAGSANQKVRVAADDEADEADEEEEAAPPAKKRR